MMIKEDPYSRPVIRILENLVKQAHEQPAIHISERLVNQIHERPAIHISERPAIQAHDHSLLKQTEHQRQFHSADNAFSRIE